jgi:hypothetical protein
MITSPLPHYLTITSPLPHHYLTITSPLPHHYLTITSLPHHYLTITSPLPHHYLTITHLAGLQLPALGHAVGAVSFNLAASPDRTQSKRNVAQGLWCTRLRARPARPWHVVDYEN